MCLILCTNILPFIGLYLIDNNIQEILKSIRKSAWKFNMLDEYNETNERLINNN